MSKVSGTYHYDVAQSNVAESIDSVEDSGSIRSVDEFDYELVGGGTAVNNL